MNARIQKYVVELAALKHRQSPKKSSNVSEQTKSAQSVCRSWQEAVADNFHDRFRAEYSVGDGFNEKIDLVDLQDAVAYELKVSKNNTHSEFYHHVGLDSGFVNPAGAGLVVIELKKPGAGRCRMTNFDCRTAANSSDECRVSN